MKGYVSNIEEQSLNNKNFREVLYTAAHSQLVVMSLNPGEEIGEEVHEAEDQFLRVELGSGRAVLEGQAHDIKAGWAVLVPAGVKHNIINTSESEMKLYTIYSPAHHRDGVVHKTKDDAEKDDEHFDGKTSN